MTAVPYTATYQSWHSQHIPQSAEQLGPTMPGFDEHERHTFKDSSQQAVGEAQDAGLPCAAAAFFLQYQAKVAAKSCSTSTCIWSAGTLVHGDAYWLPDVPSAALQDVAVPQHCCPELTAEPSAAPQHAQQPQTSMQDAAASNCGPYQACYISDMYAQPYSRPPYAVPSESSSGQLHSLWGVPSHSPQYTVAVGWPVPEPTAPLHRLSSPTTAATQAAPEECQAQADAAIPVWQQQHHPHGECKSCTGASPAQRKNSQELLCLQSQASHRSGIVSAVRDSPCMVSGSKPSPADSSTAEQNSVVARDAACQQPPVGTGLQVLASTAAQYDFEQVLLPQHQQIACDHHHSRATLLVLSVSACRLDCSKRAISK